MDQSLISFSFPGLPQIQCAFTTRKGGEGTGSYQSNNLSFDVGDDPAVVLKNRKRLQKALGFSSWHELHQVHGPVMVFDPQSTPLDAGAKYQADGLGTQTKGLVLAIKSADCQSILLAHRSGKCIAALHCGWRGNRINFPASGVLDFCRCYGLQPTDLLAVRGPSLSPQRSEFTQFDSEWGPDFKGYFHGPSSTVDLWRLTRDQLIKVGLLPENIFSLDLCTHDRDDLFFSYRRDRTTGRQMSLIWIEG